MSAKTATDLTAAARLFHALADETRLQIITCLLECEQCVCDLTDELRAGQSRLSFHLKTLKEAGLIRDRRDGRWVYYSLNPEALGEIQELLGLWKMQGRSQSSKCTD
jgi:ArsR family transcriptional regulator